MNPFVATTRQIGRWLRGPAPGERRRARRLPKRLRVQIGDFELYSTNVNAAGLQLACPTLWFNQFRAVLAPPAVTVGITLPEGRQVRAQTDVVYLCEAGDEVLVGLQFKDFAADGAGAWQVYVRHVATTAEREALAKT